MTIANDCYVDVLIVGAGPTGLMMANQLARFGVSFRIIDQQKSYSIESRAIGIQARSMEIFQNLGLADQFLQHAQASTKAHFYLKGKPKLVLDFNDAHLNDTPFPFLFFLSQSETEQILLRHLESQKTIVERQTRLISFSENDGGVIAKIHNVSTNDNEEVHCQYIIGCDGAHSTVRHLLGIPFEGASYEQEFLLADAKVEWPYPSYPGLMAFFNSKGLLLHVNLGDLKRIIAAKIGCRNKKPITREEVENLTRLITHESNLHISDVVWMTRFNLHHRAVKHFSKGRAFLAGDAAHIHSPVAAQGMNTGLQDATNLAWKIALVINKKTPQTLLDTYQLERQRVSATLMKTTDRAFGFMVSQNFLMKIIRPSIITSIMFLLGKIPALRQRLLQFMSQLKIRYKKNDFVFEDVQGADSAFLAAPQAGCRAPDAPMRYTTLFELFRTGFCHVLIFQTESIENMHYISALEEKYAGIVSFHPLEKSAETAIIFERYRISNAGIYFIRPDGYIGFRSYGTKLDALEAYLKKIFNF